jgi:uncharacterized RDD family membrane protein YckC
LKTIEFESAQHVKVEYELASTLQRTAAAMIDVVAFVIYFIIIVMILGLSDVFTDFGSQLFVTLLMIKLPWIFYNPLVEFITHGQSLGKYLLRIRVVTVGGERPGLKEVFTRWLFKGDFLWISADFFVLLWVGFGLLGIVFSATAERRQRMGDVMANTVVIKNKMGVNYSLKDVLAIKSQENHITTYPQVTRFTDEDMLLIKNTIQRVQQYPNEATKKFAIELADETARLLGLSETPTKRMEFLQTLLQDYVVLTR